MDAAFSYVSYFESVQVILAATILVLVVALIFTRHQRRMKEIDVAFKTEERREVKLVEHDKIRKPPPSSND